MFGGEWRDRLWGEPSDPVEPAALGGRRSGGARRVAVDPLRAAAGTGYDRWAYVPVGSGAGNPVEGAFIFALRLGAVWQLAIERSVRPFDDTASGK